MNLGHQNLDKDFCVRVQIFLFLPSCLASQVYHKDLIIFPVWSPVVVVMVGDLTLHKGEDILGHHVGIARGGARNQRRGRDFWTYS